jgi:outer membrane protein insertion porin family
MTKTKQILVSLSFVFIIQTQLLGQVTIKSIQFVGNDHISTSQLLESSGLREGINWNAGIMSGVNKKIITLLQENGYLFARIDSVAMRTSQNEQTVSLTWYVREDLPVYIGKIDVDADSLSSRDVKNQMESRETERYRETLLEGDLAVIGRLYASYGFPFASVDIEHSRIRNEGSFYAIDFKIKVNAGEKAILNDIIIRGNSVTRDIVILREIDMATGQPYNHKLVELIPEKLNRLGYFKSIEIPQLISLPDQRHALLIEVEEGNTTTIDGIIGYVPAPKDPLIDEGYFTGSLQLSLRNLFGTGRKFEVDWRKPDEFSDEFKLFYEEPWIFGFPVNLGLGLERIVRDTTYIERSYFLNGSLRISGNWKGTFSVVQKSSIPDSIASRTLRLARNSVLSAELGIAYDNRDYPLNPRRGLEYFSTFSFGLKRNSGPSYLIKEDFLAESEEIQKIRLGFSYYATLWQNQVISVQLLGARVSGSENQLQLTDHIWFGGSRTLRGYRENQFHGTTASWANLEYRFLIGRDSRIFIFNDWGFYYYQDESGKQQDILPGFGLGIRFNTPLGIMGVDFGFGRGDTFSRGKIHFGIVNTF